MNGISLGLRRLLIAAATLATVTLATVAHARAETGATFGLRPMNAPIRSASDNEVQRHRDFAGKPCLTVGGFARPFATNPKLFDHVIDAENNCPKAITMQVCYIKTTICVPAAVPGYGRKQVVLGTMPVQKDFRFQFQEKF